MLFPSLINRKVCTAAMLGFLGWTTLVSAENPAVSNSIVHGDQGAVAVFSVEGTGLPVVFLHADPGRATQWFDVMLEISARHPVVSYDARGAGESKLAANGDYSFAARARTLAEVVESLELDKFVIAAHSGAVAVAMTYSASHPDRVAGLFLLDPPSDPRVLPAEEWTKTIDALRVPAGDDMFLGYVASIAGSDDEVLAQVLADARQIAPDARAEMTEALSQWNPENAIREIKAPVYLLVTPQNLGLVGLWNLGDNDYAVSRTEGHWIQLDDPALVIEELGRFLDRVDGGS
jgi:pimeloyl-ACP methyl ester carboxylesterase